MINLYLILQMGKDFISKILHVAYMAGRSTNQKLLYRQLTIVDLQFQQISSVLLTRSS